MRSNILLLIIATQVWCATALVFAAQHALLVFSIFVLVLNFNMRLPIIDEHDFIIKNLHIQLVCAVQTLIFSLFFRTSSLLVLPSLHWVIFCLCAVIHIVIVGIWGYKTLLPLLLASCSACLVYVTFFSHQWNPAVAVFATMGEVIVLQVVFPKLPGKYIIIMISIVGQMYVD
jgi:hypothetical protein